MQKSVIFSISSDELMGLVLDEWDTKNISHLPERALVSCKATGLRFNYFKLFFFVLWKFFILSWVISVNLEACKLSHSLMSTDL